MITINVQDSGIQTYLGLLQQRMADLTPAMAAIGASIKSSTQLRFADQKDPEGHSWLPLSPKTLAIRRKKGRGAKILIDTGLLMGGITYQESTMQVVIGPSGPSAAYGWRHQLGAVPGGKVRAFLGFNDADRAATIDIIQRYLTK